MKSYLTVPTMCGSSVADGSGRAGEGGLFGLFRKARTMTGKGRGRAGEGPVKGRLDLIYPWSRREGVGKSDGAPTRGSPMWAYLQAKGGCGDFNTTAAR